MLKIQQNNVDRKQPSRITGTSYRGHPVLQAESSTDHAADSYDSSSDTGADLSIVRGTTTIFPATVQNDDATEEDENRKKITGRTLSISRSGRCKNKNRNQFRIKVEDIYSDTQETGQHILESSPGSSACEIISRGKHNLKEGGKSGNKAKGIGLSLEERDAISSQERLPSKAERGIQKHPSSSSNVEELLSPTSPACKKPSPKTSDKFLPGRGKNTLSTKETDQSKTEGIGTDQLTGSPKTTRAGCDKRQEEDSKPGSATNVRADENKQRKERGTKKGDRGSSLSQQFHLGNDGLCKLTLHNESASLTKVESTDL